MNLADQMFADAAIGLAVVKDHFVRTADLGTARSEGLLTALSVKCCTCTWSLLPARYCRSHHRSTLHCGFAVVGICPARNTTCLWLDVYMS